MIEIDIAVVRPDFRLELKHTFGNGITGVYGRSGVGKTTLLNAISGLIKPKSGTITIGNDVVFDSTNRVDVPVQKRGVGYVFQEGRLFPHLSVKKNLMFGFDENSQEISFDEVVALLELHPLLDKMPNKISGGERQRTALGRALLSSPRLLLLDEPFSALDYELRMQIYPLIKKVSRLVEIPILVVSHDRRDLEALTEELYDMEGAK